MEDLQRPPLDADVYEAIKVAQHEVDKRYWAELQSLRISPLTQITGEIKGLPSPPTQPIYLLNILREYASALFEAEARRYPAGDELPRWLLKLGERIEARVIESVRPNLRGELDYHATAEEMKMAVHNSLKSKIEGFESRWPGNPLARIVEGTAQSSPTRSDQPVEVLSEALRHETIGEQIKKWSIECRLNVEKLAAAINVSPRSVYRHLSGRADPSKSHLDAYEKVFSEKLKKQVRLQCPLDVKRQ